MGGSIARANVALLMACALLAMAEPAAAQRGRVDVSLASTAIAFPTPGIMDFDTGWIEHGGMLVSVQSRPAGQAWELRIRADGPTMGGYGKPVGDILWRTSTSTVWTPLTGTDQTVAQGTGDADVTLLFRIRLDWGTDLPDIYNAGITFTSVRL